LTGSPRQMYVAGPRKREEAHVPLISIARQFQEDKITALAVSSLLGNVLPHLFPFCLLFQSTFSYPPMPPPCAGQIIVTKTFTPLLGEVAPASEVGC